MGWTIKGQDGRTPSHDIDPRLGTWEDLRDAIAKIQEMGVKVILYMKFTFAETQTSWFRNELYKYASKDRFGDIHSFPGYSYMTHAQLAGINTHRLAVMCFNSMEWRKIACQEFRKATKLGAAGMLFDESCHHGGMRYCFDSHHGHHVPAYNAMGDALLAEEFHEIASDTAPDFLFGGEALYDLQQKYYSVSYVRVYDPGHIGLQRYVDPYSQIMVGVAGYDDRETINMCLMFRYIMSYEPLHFKGRLDDFPLTVNYGKAVDSLRKRYREYVWDAEYQDVLGAKVELNNGTPYDRYTVFRCLGSNKRAVVVANFYRDKPIQVYVRLDSASSALAVVTPEDQELRESNGLVNILPRSVVVVLET